MEALNKYGMSGDTSHCVQLLNSFIHHGPNGKHFVMVFEILGVNFLEIIKRYNYQGVPMPLARKLARQCLIGLDYMHRMCKIIHTDFKPENVVIGLKDSEVAEIEALIKLRNDSRAAKDWANADLARDKLTAMGIVLEDGASGTTWRRK